MIRFKDRRRDTKAGGPWKAFKLRASKMGTSNFLVGRRLANWYPRPMWHASLSPMPYVNSQRLPNPCLRPFSGSRLLVVARRAAMMSCRRSTPVTQNNKLMKTCVSGLVLFLLTSPLLLAQTVTWDGGGDGVSWHDPLNWSNDSVPGRNQRRAHRAGDGHDGVFPGRPARGAESRQPGHALAARRGQRPRDAVGERRSHEPRDDPACKPWPVVTMIQSAWAARWRTHRTASSKSAPAPAADVISPRTW